mmetsp:Transcript_9516/g.18222  ORF Transcript_9516/g.18222 Transcript_9516/m.18222 type:complete len:223 (-) Transcript_9516:212-880(-)
MPRNTNSNLTLVQLNNNAAILISDGKFQDAYKALRMAVQAQSSRISSNLPHSDIDAEQSRWNVQIASSVTASLADDDEAESSMFPYPLEVSLTGNICVEPELTSWLAAVLYNMGLACHKKAQSGGVPIKNHRKLLQQARALYIEAYGLHKVCCIPLLGLALCNNILDISMEDDADLSQVRHWNRQLEDDMCLNPTGIPENVMLHFFAANLYYSSNFVAARAA